MTVEDINDSCPADLKPYIKARELALKEQDTYVWASVGQYGVSALQATLDSLFNGRKAKCKYIEKPFTDEIKTETLTPEEEHEKLLREWVRQKKINKLNFDLWKIRQEKDGSGGD